MRSILGRPDQQSEEYQTGVVRIIPSVTRTGHIHRCRNCLGSAVSPLIGRALKRLVTQNTPRSPWLTREKEWTCHLSRGGMLSIIMQAIRSWVAEGPLSLRAVIKLPDERYCPIGICCSTEGRGSAHLRNSLGWGRHGGKVGISKKALSLGRNKNGRHAPAVHDGGKKNGAMEEIFGKKEKPGSDCQSSFPAGSKKQTRAWKLFWDTVSCGEGMKCSLDALASRENRPLHYAKRKKRLDHKGTIDFSSQKKTG